MVKVKGKIKVTNKAVSKHKKPSKVEASKHKVAHNKDDRIGNNYKKGLMTVDNEEKKFDKLFEQKLSEQYREFRNLKEHHIQTKKFIRIFIVLMTIILIALLIATFQ
jgi:hypothetical protein